MSKYDRLDLLCCIYKLFPRENPMTVHMNNSELISKLEAAEKRMAELEADLSRQKMDLSEYKQTKEKLQASEQVLKLFVEYAPAAIAMFDREMKYIAASRRYLLDYRIADQVVPGRSHYEIFPEIPERWKEIHRRCLAGARENAVEDPFPRQDGTMDWVRWEIHPWNETSGAIGGIILFSEVITERKQAEAARDEAELHYRALFEQTHDAIFILDFAGRHLAVNQRATDMLGYSREELLGLSANDISAEPAQSDQILQRLMNGESLPHYERLFRKKDGRVIPVEINVELVHDAQGKPRHIQSVVRDITDRRQAEIELQHRNDDLGLVNAINEVVVQGGNLETVVRVLQVEMKRIFSSQGCSLYMLSPDEQSLTMQHYAMPLEVTRNIEKLIGSTIPVVQIPIKEGGVFHKVLHSERGTITSGPKDIQNWLAEFAETTFLPSMARSVIRKLLPQIYKVLNIKSTIIIPLRSNGKTIGLLNSSSSSWFADDDLKRIENIGAQLTAAIQRQQAQEKIQRSEEFLNSIQNALSASIAILDETGVIVRVNAAWRKFGEQNGLRDPDDCIGQNYLEVCDSVTGPNAEEASVTARAIREVITRRLKDALVEYPCHGPE